jgi:hypothetical protein
MKCDKISYPDKQAALVHLHKISNFNTVSDKIPVRAYKCSKCQTWHLTSQKEYATETRYYKPKQAEVWNNLLEQQEIKETFWGVNPYEKQMQKALKIIYHNIDIQCEVFDERFKSKLKNLRYSFNKKHNEILEKHFKNELNAIEQ